MQQSSGSGKELGVKMKKHLDCFAVAYEGIGRDTTAFTRTVPRGPGSAVDAVQINILHTIQRRRRTRAVWMAFEPLA